MVDGSQHHHWQITMSQRGIKPSHYYVNPSIIQQDLSICVCHVKMITQKNHPATHPIQGSVFGGFGTKRPKSGEQAFSGLIGPCQCSSNIVRDLHAKHFSCKMTKTPFLDLFGPSSPDSGLARIFFIKRFLVMDSLYKYVTGLTVCYPYIMFSIVWGSIIAL